ncbi:MAG: DUF1223 domain-containing protein [Devosia sp.]
MKHAALSVALLATAALGLTAPTLAASKTLVVVELFTSQGCSSCPPANANLIKLSQRDDVLALSFAVTYWDYLGWKDSFDAPEYTDRQVAYEPPLGQQGPYTPQMVINGASTAVGINLAEVEQLISAAKPLSGPAVTLTNGSVSVGAGQAPVSGADVWLVQYDPKIINVPVTRGENTGRTLPHTHVVHSLKRLGGWTGSAISLDLPGAMAGLQTAVLVQAPHGGPILGVATN